MFLGHYAMGLALRGIDGLLERPQIEKKRRAIEEKLAASPEGGVSFGLYDIHRGPTLALFFLAVQFADLLFFTLVLAGVERVQIVEHYTASNHIYAEYLPYSHSLLAAAVWAALAFALFRFVFKIGNRGAVLVGVAVASHWFLDLPVHTPDLPLWADSSPKLGFGLWNYPIATIIIESLLTLAGLAIYMRGTRPAKSSGRYAMPIFVGIMILLGIPAMLYPPMPGNVTVMAVSAIVMMLLFAAIGGWLGTKRH